MAKIDENVELAQKIADLLKGQEEMSIDHNEHGTFIEIENVSFSFDENGKSQGLSISL
jgi:hypothetical protein